MTNPVEKSASHFIILALFLFCIQADCRKRKECVEGSQGTIKVVNNSGTTVNWINRDSSDSIWTHNDIALFPSNESGKIDPFDTLNLNAGLNQCWESFFYAGRTQYFFIFHHDTVQAIGWEEISGTDRGLLKRVKVDLNYLQNNDFTIVYP